MEFKKGEKISPETAPVGARLLVRERSYSRSLFEVTVVEWAGDGRFVKVRYDKGGEMWDEDLVRYGVLVEVLKDGY